MTDIDRLEQRLSAVERVVVDGDVALDELAELTSLADTVAELETRLDEHERRLADLEASVQSIEGYVGNVESINDDIERQSAAAVATVDRLERRIESLEVELDDLEGGILADEREHGEPEQEPAADGQNESTTADNETDDDAVFQFDGDPGETTEPEPERSVTDVLGERSRSFVDDDTDRPVSSANQSAVDSALGEDAGDRPSSATGTAASERESTRSSSESPSDAAASETDDEGLFGSLRSRLS